MKKNLISLIIVLGFLYSLLGNVANAQTSDPYPHTGYVYIDYRSEPDDKKVEEILNLLTQSGIDIKYIHGEIMWAQVQQKPSTESGAFDWSLYNKFFAKLASKGLKIYLSLGAGVDGSINEMPAFLFRRSWSIDLGQGVNKITWDPVSNEVNFQYTGSNWLWLNWENTLAKRIDIRPGEATKYQTFVKGKKGQTIYIGYNILSKTTDAWLRSTDNECQHLFVDDDKWELMDCTINFAGPLSSDEYLQFKIGSSDHQSSNFVVDLDGYSFELPNRSPPVTLTSADFPFADATKIRSWWDGNLVVDESGYHATFSDEEFQREEEAFFRETIRHIEQQSYAGAIVAYGPNNEPFVGGAGYVDYSEANRKAFAKWLGYPDSTTVEIPKRPANSWTLDPKYFGPTTSGAPTPAEWLDFDQFMREQYSFAYLNSRLSIIRTELQAICAKKMGQPCKDNYKSTFLKLPPEAVDWGSFIEDNAARFAASPYLDILGVDPYSFLYGHRDRQDIASLRSVFSGMSTIASRYGKKWGIFELGVSISDHAAKEVADLIRYSAAYGPAVVFPFVLVNNWVGKPKAGYYNLPVTPTDPLIPVNGADEVTPALAEIAGQSVAVPQADVAILHSVYNKTYGRYLGNGPLTSAISDVKDALSDLGVRTTVLYDYEVREHPHMLSWFKAIVVPRLAIARIYCETSLLDTLNRYIAGGGKVILTGEFDRRDSILVEVNEVGVCAASKVGTNIVMSNLPADILTSIPPGPNWESKIQFTNDSPFPWRNQQEVRIDTGRTDIDPFDAWFHDPQLHLSPKAGARVLANYLPSGEPAIVGSTPSPGHTLGNVIVIGPRLRFLSGDVNHDGYTDEYDLYFMKSLNGVEWGENKGFGYDRYLDYDANGKIDGADVGVWLAFSNDAFSLTEFFRIIFRDWGILPLEVIKDKSIIAHLGVEGLAIGNNSDDNRDFEIRLPYGSKTITGTLGPRQVVFRREVPPKGDVDLNGCVDLNDVKLITAQLRNLEPHNPAYDLDGDGKVTVLDARKVAMWCSPSRCIPCP